MTLDCVLSSQFFSWLDSSGGLLGNCRLLSRNAMSKKQCFLLLKVVKVYNCLKQLKGKSS